MFLVCSEHHSLLTNKWQSNTQKQTPMLAETNTKCWLKIELYCTRCDEWWRWASASNSLAQTMGLDELMSWLTPTSAVKVENENDHATGTTELEIAMKAFKRKTACGQELPCTTSWGPSYGPHRRRWRDASWIQCSKNISKIKNKLKWWSDKCLLLIVLLFERKIFCYSLLVNIVQMHILINFIFYVEIEKRFVDLSIFYWTGNHIYHTLFDLGLIQYVILGWVTRFAPNELLTSFVKNFSSMISNTN